MSQIYPARVRIITSQLFNTYEVYFTVVKYNSNKEGGA